MKLSQKQSHDILEGQEKRILRGAEIAYESILTSLLMEI